MGCGENFAVVVRSFMAMSSMDVSLMGLSLSSESFESLSSFIRNDSLPDRITFVNFFDANM